MIDRPADRIAILGMRGDLVSLLRCPACRSPLVTRAAAKGDEGTLACQHCDRRVPVVKGIPRFVDLPENELARRTQASFGYEWTHFNDWRQSGDTNFKQYFQDFDLTWLRGRLVLDAGCGMGRHARQLAPFAGRLVAVDFSRAIDQAAKNMSDLSNVDCIQADLLALPLADSTFDFIYSLGVLHHLTDTESALTGLVEKLRPGGKLRVYLYWKRHGWTARLLALVSAARRVTTRLPFGFLRALCRILSVGLYGAVVVPYRALSAVGATFHTTWPLFVYSRYPFTVLYNDQFDRFSAPIEKRYDKDEVAALLGAAGLNGIRVWPAFGWIAEGAKPALPTASGIPTATN